MPEFSKRSLEKLDTCHPDLQRLFNEVIKVFDCTILEGHRNEEEQEEDFNLGKSQKHYPDSMHNKIPSLALDVAPYPIEWSNKDRFTLFAGIVLGVASRLGIKVRWGGDWKTLKDLDHFELI